MRIYLFTFILFLNLKFIACDICGSFMGITPYDNQSQLMFLQRYRVFNGYRNYQQKSSFFIPGAYRTMHDPNAVPGSPAAEVKNHSTKDYESFKVFELRGKYFLHPRWELNFILPVQQIKTRYDGAKNSNAGLVDPSLFTAYHLIKRLNGFQFRQRLILGAGIKVPLGNYQKENNSGQRWLLLTQNGTGSFDQFYYVTYILSHRWWGLTSNSLFKFNGKNKFNERFANSYNQVLSLFTRFTVKNTTFFPSVLASYEYSKGLYVSNNPVPDTNMDLLLLGPSLDVSVKNMVFNVSYQFNAYERVSSQTLSTSGRLVVGITFNFNQSKYLFSRNN